MKRIVFFVLALVFVIIFGCQKSTNTVPSSPENPAPTNTPTPTATAIGLFVEKADIWQEQSSQGNGNAYAMIILRYGNSTGAFVSGATITIGSYTLVENPTGTYKVTMSNIGDGVQLNLSISSLAGNATSSINSPWSAEITKPSTDGTVQSSASAMEVDWRYWIINTGTLPQKVRILAWRSQDLQIYFDQTYTPITNNENTIIPAYTLPNMGNIYFRAYGINKGTIIGANGGSAMFTMYNSENAHYVSMTN